MLRGATVGGRSRVAHPRASHREHGLRRPFGRRGWNGDEVAAHLMARKPAIVAGLARRSPWGGIDDDTLVELYLSAATTVSQLAESGRRGDWRSARDLERAVIAAFRHEALGHWRTVNAQKRRADRDAVEFHAERDGGASDPLERIYGPDPREELVARDWLAQLRGQVREFWEPVILEDVGYKRAGELLGVDKAQRQALYREGIEHLGRFRALLAEGRVCQLRAPAITSYRAGTADAITAERARAHLDCCLACALTYERGASALKRGILQLFPGPVVARVLMWVRELPIGRAAETAGGAGVLALGKGVAAICAGALAVGVCATEFGAVPNPLEHHAPIQHAHQRGQTARATVVAQGPTATPTATPATTHAQTQKSSASPSPSPAPHRRSTSTTQSSTASSSQQRDERATVNEFDPEKTAAQHSRQSSDPPAGGSPTATTASAPATHAQLNEFDPETNSTAGASSPSGSSAHSASSGSSSTAKSASHGGSKASTEFGGP